MTTAVAGDWREKLKARLTQPSLAGTAQMNNTACIVFKYNTISQNCIGISSYTNTKLTGNYVENIKHSIDFWTIESIFII